MKIIKIINFLLILSLLIISACIDDSPIELNSFNVKGISTPVDRVGTLNQKKVYIGHSMPINVNIDAKYDDTDVPVQLYLVNVADVKNVDSGIQPVEDIRFFFIHNTEHTKIKNVTAGPNAYGLVLNIPADQAKDKYTGDYKIGEYYVIAEINQFDRSEINPYTVYKQVKNRLTDEDIIYVATDYLSKPDLKIENMNFVGTTEDPADSIMFYNLDLTTLPGMQNFPDFEVITLKPNVSKISFSGSVTVRSTSSDSLNAPIEFSLQSEDGSLIIPLTIYDETMKAFMDTYYIPILRKNIPETISLQLRLPDDIGGAEYFSTEFDNFLTDYAAMNAATKAQYYITALRHSLRLSDTDYKNDYGEYNFKIVGQINPTGSIQETRFIEPNNTNSTYADDGSDYSEDGSTDSVTNNTMSNDIIVSLVKMEAKPDIETPQYYPYDEFDVATRTEEDKQVVLYWMGATTQPYGLTDWFEVLAEIHGGILFQNFSLMTIGYQATINLCGQYIGFRSFFNAESHPFNYEKSYYDYSLATTDITEYFPGHYWDDADAGYSFLDVEVGDNISGNSITGYSDTKVGFEKTTIVDATFIPPVVITIPIEAAGSGVEITIGGMVQVFPNLAIDLQRDGALWFEGGLSVGLQVNASIGAEFLETLVGIAIGGSIQLITIDGLMAGYTKTYWSAAQENKVRGSLSLGPSIWISPPSGEIYVTVTVLGIETKITIFSFKSGRYLIKHWELAESDKTWWTTINNTTLMDYDWIKQQETDGKKDSCYYIETDDTCP